MSDPIIDPSHAIPAASQLRRSRFRWRIVAFIALVIAILAGLGRYATENGLAGVTDSIARVEIDGTIATDAARLKVFETIGEDASVKAVLIAINSPGGTTAGGEELYDAINKLREKFPNITGPRTDDSCYATTNRQAAVKQMAAQCDLVLVIGSTN